MENIWDTTCFSQKIRFSIQTVFLSSVGFVQPALASKYLLMIIIMNRLKFMVLFQTLIKV